jgi:hypothetical protein
MAIDFNGPGIGFDNKSSANLSSQEFSPSTNSGVTCHSMSVERTVLTFAGSLTAVYGFDSHKVGRMAQFLPHGGWTIPCVRLSVKFRTGVADPEGMKGRTPQALALYQGMTLVVA